jgi:hypothetical protein
MLAFSDVGPNLDDNYLQHTSRVESGKRKTAVDESHESYDHRCMLRGGRMHVVAKVSTGARPGVLALDGLTTPSSV